MRRKSNFASSDSEERGDERQCTVMIQWEVCFCMCGGVCAVAPASLSAFLYKPAFLFSVKHVVFLIHAPSETILWVLGAKFHDGPANKSPVSRPVYEGCDMPNLMAAQVLLTYFSQIHPILSCSETCTRSLSRAARHSGAAHVILEHCTRVSGFHICIIPLSNKQVSQSKP